ncbi:type II secretion system F family protein [Candidatus Woesearchaeota archaeon]|nr:type II secretion system F family protein [Candidatus Woesearchaeota archaeon]
MPVFKSKANRENKEITLDDLKNFNIDKSDLKRLIKEKDRVKGGVKDIEYTTYKSTRYGKVSNSFFEGVSNYLVKAYPNFFKNLNEALKMSDIKILSRTYTSMILFTGFITFFSVLLITLLIFFIMDFDVINILLRSVSLAFLAGIVGLIIMYFYPNMLIRNRRRAIKTDLPFVIIHMAAVAGSGAQPISIFNLVLNTGEYKGLEGEIRKIVNYVNLFGYDLTTALRVVANITPSPEFRELLTGLVSTIETGGDLKQYLGSKANDALTTYKLERKKYTEVLATYSDIYIGILIAAPLLFAVTLAIINMLGGRIAGFDVKFLAMVGTFIVLPFLNIVFIIFLNLVQPEV